MKAKRTTSEKAYRFLPLIAAILAFACTSYSENPAGSISEEVLDYNGKIITEFFKVSPSRTTIHAFGGDIILDFPPGTVPTTTRYSIVSFPLDNIDLRGENMMMRAFSLENVTNKNEFEQKVRVVVRYDLCNFNTCEPGEESELAIFRYLGDRYAFRKIEALGECLMNCSCKTVMGCIDDCGSYVVVEK